MNVARKSTTKLPQSWSKHRPKDGDSDSGVGSADSAGFQDTSKDEFQEALRNLKALNGGSEMLDTDVPDRTDVQKMHKEDGNKNIASSSHTPNGGKVVKECDILDRIDSIVSDFDHKNINQSLGNGKLKESAEKASAQSEEDDVVMVLPEEDKKNTKESGGSLQREVSRKEQNEQQMDCADGNNHKEKNNVIIKKKHPLQIGAKVRNTVHNLMSKLVQSGNPELSSLISKTKSEDSQDSICSTPDRSESPLLSRPRKGNLFDNLDFDISDKESRSPQPVVHKDEEGSQTVSQNNHKNSTQDQSENSSHTPETKPEEKPSASLSSVTCSEQEKCENTEAEAAVKSPLGISCSGGDKPASENKTDGALHETLKSDDTSDRDQNPVIDGRAVDETDKGIEDRDTTEVKKVTDCEENDSVMTAQSTDSGDKENDTVASEKVHDPAADSSSDGSMVLKENGAWSGVLNASSASILDSSSVTQSSENQGKDPSNGLSGTCAEPMETADTEDSCKKIVRTASPAVSDKSDSGNLTDSERKRQHESTTDTDDAQVPKRSRLDEVIGKLGERVSVPADEVNDSNDEDSMHGDSESVEKQSEEVSETASVSEEEEDGASLESAKTLRLTNKELEALVRTKVKAYMAQQQVAELRTLRLRVVELQEAQEEWRQKAKDLERQVLDLTVLQQRLEKRKAHTAALRSITTRSIGVQVNEDKLRSNTPQKNAPAKTPPTGTPAPPPAIGMPTMMWTASSQPVSQPPVLQTGTVASTPNSKVTSLTIGNNIGARNTSVAQLLSQTARMPTAAGNAATLSTTKPPTIRPAAPAKPSQPQPVSFPSARNNMLETVNSGGLKPIPAATAPSASSLVLMNAQTGQQITASKTLTSAVAVSGQAVLATPTGVTAAPAGTVKVIDLTMEDEGVSPKQPGRQVAQPAGQVRGLVPQQQLVRQISPLSQGVPGTTSTILLSSPAGTQIVGAPNLARTQGMYQVVTIANAQQLRPGSLVTVVPGQTGIVRQAAPTSVSTVSRAPTPQIITQVPPGVTLVRPGLAATSAVRPSGTSQVVTASATRMPVTLTTVPPTLAPAPQPATAPAAAARAPKSVHPAPPPPPITRSVPNETKPVPPRPGLKISRVKQGIVLSWNMSLPSDCIEIASYQLYAYQETSAPAQTSLWKKVGDVKALPLPMACTLTQFQDGNKYHFAVRAVDVHGRTGLFSEPAFIFLSKSTS